MRSILFGLPFDDLTLEETLEEVGRIVVADRSEQWCTANLDFALRATRDWEFNQTLRRCQRILCDSQPLKLLSRWLGRPVRARVTGADLTREILNQAPHRGWRIFLLGVTESVLRKCQARTGGARIEHYAPPYSALEAWDHQAILARIAAARPHILLVALGSPKQDIWLRAFRDQLQIPLMIGIGASLEYYAGAFRRAPRLWQRLGAEWIYRLLQEPRRLAGRYFGNAVFLLSNGFYQWSQHRRCGGGLWCEFDQNWPVGPGLQTPDLIRYLARFQRFAPDRRLVWRTHQDRLELSGDLTLEGLHQLEQFAQPLDLSKLARADLRGRLWIQEQRCAGRIEVLPSWWCRA